MVNDSKMLKIRTPLTVPWAKLQNPVATAMAPKSGPSSSSSSARQRPQQRCQVSIWALLLTNLLVFQITYHSRQSNDMEELISTVASMTFESPPESQPQPTESTTTESTTTTTTQETSIHKQQAEDPMGNYMLAIPQGKAKALPSVRLDQPRKPNEVVTADAKSMASSSIDRKIAGGTGMYGGEGDKAHLGGFTDMDIQGISPATWKWMVQSMGVRSMVDVGCGRGLSTSWFVLHGVESLCVEGSHDARERTVLPDPDTQMVEHDFSRGPYWPAKTYDAVWCVEFLEHVGRNFHQNYLPTFRKAALIFATHSNWGGWHHVEVHKDPWWILKFEMYGFKYSPELTNRVRDVARQEKNTYKVPNGKDVNAQHVWLTMMVFVNPAVAALPQHAHLLYEPGCYQGRKDGNLIQRDCGTGPKKNQETPLPDQYKPLNLTQQQDDEWFEWIKARVTQVQ